MNVFHHHNCNCLFFQQECGIRLEQCINDWLSLTKTALKILSLVIYSRFVISVFKNLGLFKQHHLIILKTEVVKMQLIFQNGRSHIKVMMDIQYVWFKCSMIIICQNDRYWELRNLLKKSQNTWRNMGLRKILIFGRRHLLD